MKVAINEGPAANVDVDSRWYVESRDKILNEFYVEYSKQKKLFVTKWHNSPEWNVLFELEDYPK